MPLPKAELDRQSRLEAIGYLPKLFDDISNHSLEQPNKKKQIICSCLVVFDVVLLETYVEALVTEGQEFLLRELDDFSKFGWEVLLPVSEDLKQRKDQRSVWALAGAGWKDELRKRRKALLEGFHTPRPENIDDLVFITLGLKDVSKNWKWSGASNETVRKRLNELITLRGAIAHDLLSAPKLTFDEYIKQGSFSVKTCTLLANQIRDHIQALTGKIPWDPVTIE
jgi:hypothetical protein